MINLSFLYRKTIPMQTSSHSASPIVILASKTSSISTRTFEILLLLITEWAKKRKRNTIDASLKIITSEEWAEKLK